MCGDGEQRSGLRCWLVTVVLVDRLVPCGVHGPGGTRPSSAGSGRRLHPAASHCPNEQTVFPWVSGHLHREHGRVSGWVQGPHSLWRLGRLGWV